MPRGYTRLRPRALSRSRARLRRGRLPQRPEPQSAARIRWDRAIVRHGAVPKPRASIASARRVARRTAPTSSASSLPKARRAAATGDHPALTPRARRAIPSSCHSRAMIGSMRTAASTPTASRGERRACCCSESARSVGSVVAMATTPESAIPSSRRPRATPVERSGPPPRGRCEHNVEDPDHQGGEQQRPRTDEQGARPEAAERQADQDRRRARLPGGSAQTPRKGRPSGSRPRPAWRPGWRVPAGRADRLAAA